MPNTFGELLRVILWGNSKFTLIPSLLIAQYFRQQIEFRNVYFKIFLGFHVSDQVFSAHIPNAGPKHYIGKISEIFPGSDLRSKPDYPVTGNFRISEADIKNQPFSFNDFYRKSAIVFNCDMVFENVPIFRGVTVFGIVFRDYWNFDIWSYFRALNKGAKKLHLTLRKSVTISKT